MLGAIRGHDELGCRPELNALLSDIVNEMPKCLNNAN